MGGARRPPLVGAGAWLLWEREAGTRERVTVDSCLVQRTGRSYSEYCTGSWTLPGHLVVGPVDGATSSQEGETIDATVRRGTAYSRSPAVAFILIGLSLPFFLVPCRWARGLVRRLRAVRSVAPAAGPPHMGGLNLFTQRARLLGLTSMKGDS